MLYFFLGFCSQSHLMRAFFGVFVPIDSARELGKYYPQPKGTTREQVWGGSALCAPGHNRWHWPPYLLKPIKLNIEQAKLDN